MKRVLCSLLLLCFAIFFFARTTLADDKERDANVLLQRAVSAMATQKHSFHMEGTLIIHVKAGALAGTFVEDSLSERRDRKEARVSNYEEVRVTDVDHQFIKRSNARFSPMPIEELFKALTPSLRAASGTKIAKLKDAKISGTPVRCITLKHPYAAEVWCFDSATGVLRSTDYVMTHVEYDKWVQQDGLWHPGRIEIRRKGLLETEAEITSFGPARAASDVLAVPQGSTERAWCDSPTPPRAVSMPDPEFPPGSTRRDAQVIFRLLVDDTGHIADGDVMQSASTPYDEEAWKAVRTWKFEPARCGPKPIPSEINVEVNFRTMAGSPAPLFPR